MGFKSRPVCGHSLTKCRPNVARRAPSLWLSISKRQVMAQWRAIVGAAVQIVRRGH